MCTFSMRKTGVRGWMGSKGCYIGYPSCPFVNIPEPALVWNVLLMTSNNPITPLSLL